MRPGVGGHSGIGRRWSIQKENEEWFRACTAVGDIGRYIARVVYTTAVYRRLFAYPFAQTEVSNNSLTHWVN